MSTPDTPPLRSALRHDGTLLAITLDRPKANVLDGAMIAALEETVRQAGEDPRLRAVTIEGAGRHFSFGASVAEHQVREAPAMLRRFHRLFRVLDDVGLPTCALVRGQCLGGGLELAAWCTWIFASPDARFGQPEIKLAVFPPLASVLLPWRIGGGSALDLCVSGRTIDADEALRRGLVSRVAEDPAAAYDAFFTAELQRLSPSSLRHAERAARLGLRAILERDLPRLENTYLDELAPSPDAVEGIAAFLERREPTYPSEEPPR